MPTIVTLLIVVTLGILFRDEVRSWPVLGQIGICFGAAVVIMFVFLATDRYDPWDRIR